jgi:phage-related protein
VLWFYDEGRLVICSHGFVKRTRKTPAAELERARATCVAYRAAKNNATLQVEDETR